MPADPGEWDAGEKVKEGATDHGGGVLGWRWVDQRWVKEPAAAAFDRLSRWEATEKPGSEDAILKSRSQEPARRSSVGRSRRKRGLSGAWEAMSVIVDDGDVPPGVFEVGAVFAILLQGVDGVDGLVEVAERIVVGGYLAADFLEVG